MTIEQLDLLKLCKSAITKMENSCSSKDVENLIEHSYFSPLEQYVLKVALSMIFNLVNYYDNRQR